MFFRTMSLIRLHKLNPDREPGLPMEHYRKVTVSMQSLLHDAKTCVTIDGESQCCK